MCTPSVLHSHLEGLHCLGAEDNSSMPIGLKVDANVVLQRLLMEMLYTSGNTLYRNTLGGRGGEGRGGEGKGRGANSRGDRVQKKKKRERERERERERIRTVLRGYRQYTIL